jgi:hypothetical protein
MWYRHLHKDQLVQVSAALGVTERRIKKVLKQFATLNNGQHMNSVLQELRQKRGMSQDWKSTAGVPREARAYNRLHTRRRHIIPIDGFYEFQEAAGLHDASIFHRAGSDAGYRHRKCIHPMGRFTKFAKDEVEQSISIPTSA